MGWDADGCGISEVGLVSFQGGFTMFSGGVGDPTSNWRRTSNKDYKREPFATPYAFGNHTSLPRAWRSVKPPSR